MTSHNVSENHHFSQFSICFVMVEVVVKEVHICEQCKSDAHVKGISSLPSGSKKQQLSVAGNKC